MKRSVIFALVMVVAIAMNVSVFAAAGGAGGGNGGDNYPPETGSAWFLGQDQKINTCYQIYPGFPVTSAAIEAMLTNVFSVWKNYYDNALGTHPGPGDFRLRLSFDLNFVPCDGTQDLTIYLGGDSGDIDTAKNQYVDPIGFAQRTQYNLDTGRGKGFVWVKLDHWSSDQLYGILMHEVGHVLGCGHILGTIMDPQIAAMVGAPGDDLVAIERDELHHIDHNRFLAKPTYGLDLVARFSEGNTEEVAQLRNAFKYFTEKDPVGTVTSKVHWLNKDVVVTLSDSIGRFDISLHKQQPIADFYTDQTVFRATLRPSGMGTVTTTYGAGGFVWMMSSDQVAAHGKPVSFLFGMNNNFWPLNISYLDDQGRYQNLFASDYAF